MKEGLPLRNRSEDATQFIRAAGVPSSKPTLTIFIVSHLSVLCKNRSYIPQTTGNLQIMYGSVNRFCLC